MRCIQGTDRGHRRSVHHAPFRPPIEWLERRLFLSVAMDVVIGAGAAKSVTFPAVGGATATINVTGGGSATVHFSGDSISQSTKSNAVTLSGANISATGIDGTQTTPNSVLKVTTKGGKGSLTIGQITTNGSFRSIQGTPVVLTNGVVVTGSVGQINVQGITGGPITLPVGATTTIQVATSASFDLTAGAVKSIKVGGNLANSTITLARATQGSMTDLSSLSVKGAITGLMLNSHGSLGTISATSMTGSTVFSGVATLATGQLLPNSNGDFDNVNKINSLKLKRTNGTISFANSYVAAHNLGSINLGGVLLSNGGTPFGLAANKYNSLSFVAGASGKTITVNNVTSQSKVTNAFSKAGVDPQDFQAKVVT